MAWSSSLKGEHTICHKNGKIEYNGSKRSNIRTSSPISASASKFYFEITILSCSSGADIDIGLVTNDVTNNCLLRGGNNMIGYNTCDGRLHHCGTIVSNADRFREDDTGGCEIKRIMHDKSTFIVCRLTGTGIYVGEPRVLDDAEFYPCLAFDYQPAIVVPNFGEKKFAFQIKGNI